MHPASISLKSKMSIALSVVFSALCFYFGNGLNGDYWFLVWIAPAPLLVISIMYSKKLAFLAAFTAYLLGRLSWFAYLEELATTIPALIYTILPASVFAGVILLSASRVLQRNKWFGLFAFPSLFTAVEFLMSSFSPMVQH